MPLIICITGMPGSGKSIVSKAAVDLGLRVYNMGDIIREETLKKYGKITPELMRQVSIDLRKKYGEDIVAIRTIEKALESREEVFVIDGVRSLKEIEVFKEYGNVVIIAVHASPRTRFERIVKRRRAGDPSTWDEFVKRDYVELSFGIGNVIALADYMIVNEGTIEEAYKSARHILARLIEDVRKSRS